MYKLLSQEAKEALKEDIDLWASSFKSNRERKQLFLVISWTDNADKKELKISVNCEGLWYHFNVISQHNSNFSELYTKLIKYETVHKKGL